MFLISIEDISAGFWVCERKSEAMNVKEHTWYVVWTSALTHFVKPVYFRRSKPIKDFENWNWQVLLQLSNV